MKLLFDRGEAMGIRMDQHAGLNVWARTFVEGESVLAYTEQVVRVYPDGRRERVPDRPVYHSTVLQEESGVHYSGMFGDEYPLMKYTFPDGKVYYERVQDAPWSSGPVFFLALQDEEGRWVSESLWPEAEIAAA